MKKSETTDEGAHPHEKKKVKEPVLLVMSPPSSRTAAGRRKHIAESDAYLRRVGKGTSEWNAGEIIKDKLYIGNLLDARNLVALEKYGITHVLTAAQRLRVYGAKGEKKPSYLRNCVLKLADHPNQIILSDEALGHAVKFIDEAMHDTDGRILVHCASGISRSVSMVIGWLMIKQKISFEAALRVVRKGRPVASPNFGFRFQLIELEKCEGNLHKALDEFKTRLRDDKMNPIQLAMRQRRRAQEFHEEINTHAGALQKATTSGDDAQLAALNRTTQDILDRVEATIAKMMSTSLCDRPALSIAKSARARIRALLNPTSDAGS